MAVTLLVGCGEDFTEARAAQQALLPLPLSLRPAEGGLVFDGKPPVTVVVDPSLDEEAYTLLVTSSGVRIGAGGEAGAFYAAQTLAQLIRGRKLAAVEIRDRPRFAWRGLMLDVARHFFGVDEVKRLIELVAHYKMNRLHLHLTDDQGWRLEIRSWPRLASIGGASAVGGAPGGFYTQAELAELVAFAAERFVTLVPEIDMPGHTNAALASYAELNCDGILRQPYTGTQVGLSSLCIGAPATERFVRDVVGELAALVPGGWLHIGGDEAHQTAEEDYRAFIAGVAAIIQSQGLRMIGWEEVARAGVPSTVQYWLGNLPSSTTNPVLLSPATRAYLDMKYDSSTPVGTSWVGYVEVDQAYEWDPEDHGFSQVVGLEAALWTESVATRSELDLMIFPRLLGHAEIAWSPRAARDFAGYARRLPVHGERLAAQGVGYHRSPLIAW